MKFLIKLFCLLSLLSSFGFSENIGRDLSGARNSSLDFYAGSLPSVNASFLSDNFIKIDNDVFQTSSPNYFGFNYSLGVSWTGFRADFKNNYLFFYNPSFQKQYTFCQFDKGNNLGCSDEYEKYIGQGDFRKITFSYLERYSIIKFITCNAGENFNTSLRQCVPACPAGQSWDAENNLCYVDCSDKNLNKYGYPNGTAQGGCVDCSNALSDDQIMRCACSGFGSSYNPGVMLIDLPFKFGSCYDGKLIRFKPRLNDNDKDNDKKNDNNSTNLSDKGKEKPKPDKDKENPKPDKDKDKKNDNNSTNSSNKDNSNPDKKDNNENSNNSSGESGNSSNNNSGGSSGNGSSGGGGFGVETKPNPNSGNGKEDGKGDGKQDGKGEEGKGDDNIGPAKLDYEGLKASADTFEGQFKTAVDDSFRFVNDVKASLTDTIQKIKDGNLIFLKKGAVPTTCPLSFQIDMTYFSKNLTFDFCKIVSPVSSSLYILFYLGFFILFLVVTIKLFILTFMGW